MGSEGGGGGGNFSAALSDHDAVGALTGAAAALAGTRPIRAYRRNRLAEAEAEAGPAAEVVGSNSPARLRVSPPQAPDPPTQGRQRHGRTHPTETAGPHSDSARQFPPPCPTMRVADLSCPTMARILRYRT